MAVATKPPKKPAKEPDPKRGKSARAKLRKLHPESEIPEPGEPRAAEASAKPLPKANGKAAPDLQTRLVESYPHLKKLNQKRREAQAQLTSARADLEESRDTVKEAESHLELINEDISKSIFEIENPAPLYAVQALPNGKKGAGKPAVAGPAEGDESWRETPVREALPGLGKKVYEGMESKQLSTLGKLIDWKNKDAGANWFTDIPGVGKAAVDKIDDAIEAFFAKQKAAAQSAPQAPAATRSEGAYDAVNAVALAGLAIIKDRAPICGALHLAGLKTIGDAFALADKEKSSIIDSLRGKGLTLDQAGYVDEAIKAAIKDADAKKPQPAEKGGK
jgi:hypothetical protein